MLCDSQPVEKDAAGNLVGDVQCRHMHGAAQVAQGFSATGITTLEKVAQ